MLLLKVALKMILSQVFSSASGRRNSGEDGIDGVGIDL